MHFPTFCMGWLADIDHKEAKEACHGESLVLGMKSKANAVRNFWKYVNVPIESGRILRW